MNEQAEGPGTLLIVKEIEISAMRVPFGGSNAPFYKRRGFRQERHWGTRFMSCRDTIHLICWYLEGKLSPTVEREIETHIRECADCHLVLEAATNTLDRYFGEPTVLEPETNPQAA